MKAGVLEIELLANMARLAKDMDQAKRSVGGAMDSIEKSVNLAKTALGALGVGLSVGAFVGWIQGAIDAADHLNDLSKATGIAVDDLAGLKLAAQQSGGDLDSIAQSINKLSVNMGKEPEKFAKIGISAKDPIEALKQLSDIYRSIQDPQTRAAFGAEALGKSWAGAAPLLSEGGEKISEMVERGKRLSGVTQEMADQADKFNDQLAEMKTNSGALGTKLATELLPGLNAIVAAMREGADEGSKLRGVLLALDRTGAFLFSDEYANANVQIKNLEGKINDLETKKRNFIGPSWLQAILIGSDDDIKKTIIGYKAEIDMLADSLKKPPEKPAIPKGPGDTAISDFIGGSESTKKYDAAIKKSEEFIAQIKKEANAIGSSLEEKKIFEAEEVAGQMRLAGVRDDVLLRFLNNALKEAEALQSRHDLKEAEKATTAAAEAQTKYVDSLAGGLKKLQEETQAQKDYNDRLGLSKEAIAALDAAKLEANAATLDAIAIKKLDRDLDETQYNLYKAQADELRKQANLKREGGAKEDSLDKEKKALEDAQKTLDNFRENVQRNLGDELFNMLDGNFDNIGQSFGRMLKRMIADAMAADVMNAIMGKGKGASGSALADLGGGFLKLIGMGGGGMATTGVGGLSLADNPFAMSTFDGGGFTGSGPRSGGIDGKGGFPAIMHPQETVIDHSRGQSGGGGKNVTMYQTNYFQGNAGDAALAEQMMRLKEVTKAEVIEEMNR